MSALNANFFRTSKGGPRTEETSNPHCTVIVSINILGHVLNSGILAPTHRVLAEKHYQLRFDELRELILAEENAFKYDCSGPRCRH